MIDSKRLFRLHGVPMVAGTVAALIGMLLCLTLTPTPHMDKYVAVEASKVAKWASSPDNAGLELASDVCDGGTAESVSPYNNLTSKCADVDQGRGFCVECEAPRLSRRAYVTLGITITTLTVMIAGAPPDLSMLAASLVLVVWPWSETPGAGIISEAQAWQGMSNRGVLTVGALFITAKAVGETGIVTMVMSHILGKPGNLFLAQMRLLIPVAIGSAFMNNTPIVAMLIPVIESWAPKIGQSPSKFMMPLSFASMLGGMCTMMGTSTNLVVAGLLAKKNPEVKPLGLFDIAPVGGPCALLGILYMAVMCKYLLPAGEEKASDPGTDEEVGDDGAQRSADTAPFDAYMVWFVCGDSYDGSRIATPATLSLADARMRIHGYNFSGIIRYKINHVAETSDGLGAAPELPELPDGQLYRPKDASWEGVNLRRGDILILEIQAKALGEIRRSLAREDIYLVSELPTLHKRKHLGRRRNRRFLVEAVVGRRSSIFGMARGVEELSEIVLEKYGASLISIRNEHVRPKLESAFSRRLLDNLSSRDLSESKLTDELLPESESRSLGISGSGKTQQPLVESGDVVLMEVFPDSISRMDQGDFTLVTTVPGSQPPRTGTTMDTFRQWVAGVVLILMVGLSAANVVSLLTAALFASAILLLCKTITLRMAFAAVNGRTLLAIVTTFGVGTAFEETGLAHTIAVGLISAFGSLGKIGVLLSVAIVTSVVGCAVSNNAVVILMYPICVTLAREVEGVSLKQLLAVLLVGASSSFLTPMSYQTNLMVFTPGKYKFSDYAKFGFGLQLLMVACSVGMGYAMADYYKN